MPRGYAFKRVHDADLALAIVGSVLLVQPRRSMEASDSSENEVADAIPWVRPPATFRWLCGIAGIAAIVGIGAETLHIATTVVDRASVSMVGQGEAARAPGVANAAYIVAAWCGLILLIAAGRFLCGVLTNRWMSQLGLWGMGLVAVMGLVVVGMADAALFV